MRIYADAVAALEKSRRPEEVDALKLRILGKKGELTQILRGMGALSAEERPKIGQKVNEYRDMLDKAIAQRQEELKAQEKALRMEQERVDVTMPARMPEVGHLHPISVVREELEDIFIGMGFEVAEGPEVELDRFNFELLNLPKNHPARDMQDSFYINESMLLRTHTSPVQARTMTTRKPPIRIICPGRVYRVDEVDATHSPVFHQIEGLVVDEGINMGHLKGTLDIFAKEFYGADTRTRFRPSFFPFTEPSAEMDISCYVCGGHDENCRVCKGTGWIEILGCGMVNPKVLELCGIDPDIYSGFAFGMGLDRIAVSRYGVSDLRMFFENDIRFLGQI